MIDFIQPTRIELPKSVDEGARLADEGPIWLPRQKGHTGLKFSNGLEMAHNAASKATDRYRCPLKATYERDGYRIETTEDLGLKAIMGFLSSKMLKGYTQTTRGPLKFSNGFGVTHSDESRALADYANKVDKGEIDIGMKATFTCANGTKVEGIQTNHAKLSRLLKTCGR